MTAADYIATVAVGLLGGVLLLTVLWFVGPRRWDR